MADRKHGCFRQRTHCVVTPEEGGCATRTGSDVAFIEAARFTLFCAVFHPVILTCDLACAWPPSSGSLTVGASLLMGPLGTRGAAVRTKNIHACCRPWPVPEGTKPASSGRRGSFRGTRLPTDDTTIPCPNPDRHQRNSLSGGNTCRVTYKLRRLRMARVVLFAEVLLSRHEPFPP